MNPEKLLQQLISIPSVSGSEQKVQKWIFDYLSQLGLKPKWVGQNVVCNIKGINTSKCIIFNGHTDTVSVGDIKQWNTNPFKLNIKGNKLYGLGTSDMKSGVAAMISLAQTFVKTKPPVDLWFHFVVGEETDGSGTATTMQWFANNCIQKYKIINGIIGEATENKEIRIAHKGNIFIKVISQGDSGHGSKPELIKTHAVMEMYKAAAKLKKLVESWEKKYKNPLLGKPTVSLFTSFSAGEPTSPNKIAGKAQATFDVRTTPEIHKGAFKLIKQNLNSKFIKVEAAYTPLPPGYTNPSEHIVRVVKKVSSAKVAISVGSTDLLFFTKYNIPAIIFGPGTLSQGHNFNEYCKISDLTKSVEVYKKIIASF